jgi:uncharacterized membrane protein
VGAVLAGAGDRRVSVLGLLIAAVAASLVASPLPTSLAITAWVLGSLLAAYLLWLSAGSGTNRGAARIGPIAGSAIAAAAFLAGLTVRPVDPLMGPEAGQAAGFALIALAIVPIAGRDVFRMGIGVLLFAIGGDLLMASWSGMLPDLQELAMAALIVGIAGATSLLTPTMESRQPAEEAARAKLYGEPDAGPVDSIPAAILSPVGPHAPQASPKPAPQAVPAAPPRPAPTLPDAPAATQPRPMTADPIDGDEWAAWTRPDPAPRRRDSRKPSTPGNGATKSQGESSPDLDSRS